jgi:hypothetical protein
LLNINHHVLHLSSPNFKFIEQTRVSLQYLLDDGFSFPQALSNNVSTARPAELAVGPRAILRVSGGMGL